MFSMSMTTGPAGRVLMKWWRNGVLDYWSVGSQQIRHFITSLLRLLRSFLVVSDLRAFLKFTTDRAVAAGDHFITGLNAGLNFHVSVVRDSRRHFRQLGFAALFQKHDLGQFLALFLLRSLFLAFVYVIRVVVAFIARGALQLFLFDFLRAQIAITGSN